MPKTRDAFALRGFDDKIIFSYIEAGFRGQSDEELLSPYYFFIRNKDFADDDEKAALAKLSLAQFMTMANQFQTRLTRHNNRLMRYAVYLVENFDVDETVQTKIRRAKIFSACYADAARAAQDLQKKLHRLIMAIDDCREEKYRRCFSERLREARRANGMTQLQVAEKLEMTASGYTQYERARREPSIATLAKIARILNRSVDWLLGLTP